jgi:hypothetical protein
MVWKLGGEESEKDCEERPGSGFFRKKNRWSRVLGGMNGRPHHKKDERDTTKEGRKDHACCNLLVDAWLVVYKRWNL